MIDLTWRRSSRCRSTTNVEVAGGFVTVAMRDSADPDGPVLRFGRGAWVEFVEGVRAGDYDS